ncbi:MAG: aminomethyltransferase family protein, partial [Pseudomonadota bacterium]
ANLPASDCGPDRVWYGSAAASEFHDMDWLRLHMQADEEVQIRSLTNDQTILVLAGPKSRHVLSAVSRHDWSQNAFPWLSARETFIGAAPATVLGVSFSGELAYEIHVPNGSLLHAYQALRRAGEVHGMTLFGSRAVESMRMEKGFLHWKSDILTEFDPYETGLDRFVKLDKPDFVGKAELLDSKASGPRRKLVTLAIDTEEAVAQGGASVRQGDGIAGTVTSADWGHRTGLNLAYAFVEPKHGELDQKLTVDILGQRIAAKVVRSCPYDPSFSRMRA